MSITISSVTHVLDAPSGTLGSVRLHLTWIINICVDLHTEAEPHS